ncbi:MAG TPA: phage major capsid protein, partial [Arenicellales bacterium]|nr:phage major capsid protein [Arenicellales bacterium]
MTGQMSEEMKAAVEAVESKLGEAVQKYETQVKENGEATAKIRDEVKALADEHADLMKDTPELKDRLKAVEQQLAEGMKNPTEKAKTWGELFTESESFKDYREGGKSARAHVEVKNTILGESGSPGEPSDTVVSPDRQPGIVPGAFRMLNVLDFVPTGGTSSNAIEYTRESSWTNDAAETNEGNTKPESDLTFELVSDPVRTIAHFIKASKQILDDAPMLQSYIDRRMEHGLRQRLQSQILKGNGTSPNISGLSASGRHTAFTPQTGEHALDSLNRAKYAVIGADYMPNFIFMNPADFGGIERLKEGDTS